MEGGPECSAQREPIWWATRLSACQHCAEYCSERPNFQPLDFGELIGFLVETKEMVTSEKAGRDDIENIIGSQSVLCGVPGHRFLEKRLQC